MLPEEDNERRNYQQVEIPTELSHPMQCHGETHVLTTFERKDYLVAAGLAPEKPSERGFIRNAYFRCGF